METVYQNPQIKPKTDSGKQETIQKHNQQNSNQLTENLFQNTMNKSTKLFVNCQSIVHSQTIKNQLNQNSHENFNKPKNKSLYELLAQVKKILKKSPEIRTPNDSQLLLQLIQHNKFLSQLVNNVGLDCFKGLMKQAKIEQVRERQLLCEQGKPITHIVVLFDGKLGIIKQEDDFSQEIQQSKILLNSKHNQQRQQLSCSKMTNKQKQNSTISTKNQIGNTFDELTAMSCKQIQMIRKKSSLMKRKSSVPITAGLSLPLPFNQQQYDQYEIESYVNPGEQYGAQVRCKSKLHTNTCLAVENSFLLVIQVNAIIYWFEHSFRAKLGETVEKLKKIPAFSFLDDGKLAECILHMKKVKKKRNDYLYKQGWPSDNLYILIHGQIKLSKQAKLFEENPNQLYVDRRKLMQKNLDPLKKEDESKRIDILPYANLTSLYNFRPKRKNIDIGKFKQNLGITTSVQDCFVLFGEQQMLQKRPRETNVLVTSFDCEYHEIQIRKLDQILGSKYIEEFYSNLEMSAKKVILYRQNQYAEKINLENRSNLDYFYFEDNKSKDSPRKYKLEKINSKLNDIKASPLTQRASLENSNQPKLFDNQTIKPYYTTFNFHKLVKTERLSHAKKTSQLQDATKSSIKKRKKSEDSQENIKMKFDPVQERLIDISHTWKPIKKKVIQQIKVMQKISPKLHCININEPLIEQKYFRDLQKEQKRIKKEHRVFVLSLGKRTKW